MKIVIDFNACMGNALCMMAAPEVFEVRDDGMLYLLQEQPAESLRSAVEKAARMCPTQAITIEG